MPRPAPPEPARRTGVRFAVLGALEVVTGEGERVEVGGAQPRTILAALLAAEGQVVSTDALMDAIWGDRQPASAAAMVQSYVSRLRHRIAGAPLTYEPPGYRLAVGCDEVDFRRFQVEADEGRQLLDDHHTDHARRVLAAALALWKGDAFAEFAALPLFEGLAARLRLRRLAALGDRIEADLALGRHTAVVGELTELVGAAPLGEDSHRQLALALYRCGRQAEALAVISELRRRLDDELGVDLSPPLRALEVSILQQDPRLDHAPAQTPPRDTEGAESAPPLPGSAELVGRRVELAQLVEALDEGAAAVRVSIVEGEPGIGKTRLAEELAAIANRRGVTTLWTQAYEGDTSPALWSWLPVLEELSQGAAEGSSGELRALLDRPGDRAAQFALVDAAAARLRSAMARGPVVLIIDDIQWADTPSLDLLVRVLGRLRGTPLTVVCTVRPVEYGHSDDVRRALTVLSRQPGSRRIVLARLAEDETAQLAVQTLGARAAGHLLAEIHERSDGNPFFATEIARLVAAGHRLTDVPAGVRDVVGRRLAELPAPARAMVDLAAVVGCNVDLRLLARAAGTDLDACLDDLEPALGRRVLLAHPDRSGWCRFSHILVRDVAMEEMSPFRKARRHLDIALALDDHDDHAEIIAEHLWRAAPLASRQRTAAALERAARTAGRRFAYAAAEQALQRAVALRGDDDPDRDVAAELAAIVLLVAVTGAHRGRAGLVDSPLVTRGRSLATTLGRTKDLFVLLAAEWSGLDQRGDLARAERVARELRERASTMDDPGATVMAQTASAISCWHWGAVTEAAAYADVAAAGVREGGTAWLTDAAVDQDQLRMAVPLSLYLHDLVGDLAEPEQAYESAIELFPGDRYWQLIVWNFASSGALSVGDTDRSIRSARRGIAADPDAISAFWSLSQRCKLGAALCLAGEFGEGLPLLDASWRAYREAGLRANGTTWLASAALGLARAGRLDEAVAWLDLARVELDGYGDRFAESTVLLAEAALLAAQGGDPRAVAHRARRVATEQGAHAMAAYRLR